MILKGQLGIITMNNPFSYPLSRAYVLGFPFPGYVGIEVHPTIPEVQVVY